MSDLLLVCLHNNHSVLPLACHLKKRVGDSLSEIIMKSDPVFSFISINWRAKPPTSGCARTDCLYYPKEGRAVTACKDSPTYPTGIKVSDEELAALNLSRDPFHDEWNYTIRPHRT